MIRGSRGATALVGVPGFVVGANAVADGELRLPVATAADLLGCSGCGTRAVGHGRHKTLVRDLPISGRPTVLVWAKRRGKKVAADQRGEPAQLGDVGTSSCWLSLFPLRHGGAGEQIAAVVRPARPRMV